MTWARPARGNSRCSYPPQPPAPQGWGALLRSVSVLRVQGLGCRAVHKQVIKFKPFWQRSLLHDFFNNTSKEHAV